MSPSDGIASLERKICSRLRGMKEKQRHISCRNLPSLPFALLKSNYLYKNGRKEDSPDRGYWLHVCNTISMCAQFSSYH
jgi:hypothetical protein